MARTATRTPNRGESSAGNADRSRLYYTAPTPRADATDAPERGVTKRQAGMAPAGSIAAIELVLGF